MRVTLVRHGETTGQSSIRYYGVSDVPLSDTGREQMLRVREAIREEPFDTVFTSRLCRSTEAAEIITAGRRIPTQPIAAFDEINFGRWEGWTREEIAHRDPENFRLWQERRDSFHYPDGDSRAEFHARVSGGLATALNGSNHRNILMVLHRGVISVILSELLALSQDDRYRIEIDLGSIHVVLRDGDTWRPHVLDRVDHLGGVEGGPPKETVDQFKETLRLAQGERKKSFENNPGTAQAELVEASFRRKSKVPK